MRPLPRRWKHPASTHPGAHDSGSQGMAVAPVTAPAPSQPLPRLRSQPATHARSLQHEWVAAMLNEQKTGVPPLHQALLDRDIDIAGALLDAGASVKAEIRPPLQLEPGMLADLFSIANPEGFARRAGDRSSSRLVGCITELVAQACAAAPRSRPELAGANALTLALLCDAPDMLLAKICALGSGEYAGILDHRDGQGRTPLTLAVQRAPLEKVALLLALGANPDCKNSLGQSPLQLAVALGRAEIFGTLLEFGAGLDTEGGNLLEQCLSGRRLDLLAACERVSARHRVAVFRCLHREGKSLLSATTGEFEAFFAWAQPLLTPKRIAKLAIAAAGLPGRAAQLELLCARAGTEFPPERLAALRAAAKKSGDPAHFRIVATRFPS